MRKIHITKCEPISDKSGKLWLPYANVREANEDGVKNISIIEVGDSGDCDYYEVIGYSAKRKAYWIEKVDFSALTDSLEDELEEYVKRLGYGES